MYSRGISTCDTFAMRPRQATPLREVKEEYMTTVAEATQTVTTEYNGWCNRETWIVNLWMTGDQGYYEQLCEIISSHDNLDGQAEALEDWIRFEYDGEYSSIWADLINNSLAEVDWYAIVKMNQE